MKILFSLLKKIKSEDLIELGDKGLGPKPITEDNSFHYQLLGDKLKYAILESERFVLE